jgi:hypothetical protein
VRAASAESTRIRFTTIGVLYIRKLKSNVLRAKLWPLSKPQSLKRGLEARLNQTHLLNATWPNPSEIGRCRVINYLGL